FIATKVWLTNLNYQSVLKAAERSIRRLYLHRPLPSPSAKPSGPHRGNDEGNGQVGGRRQN
ncbi:MAG: hypothetical protein ACUVQY_06970, partial [Thermoproteota archaeon]